MSSMADSIHLLSSSTIGNAHRAYGSCRHDFTVNSNSDIVLTDLNPDVDWCVPRLQFDSQICVGQLLMFVLHQCQCSIFGVIHPRTYMLSI